MPRPTKRYHYWTAEEDALIQETVEELANYLGVEQSQLTSRIGRYFTTDPTQKEN